MAENTRRYICDAASAVMAGMNRSLQTITICVSVHWGRCGEINYKQHEEGHKPTTCDRQYTLQTRKQKCNQWGEILLFAGMISP